MTVHNPTYIQDICYTAQDDRLVAGGLVCQEGVSAFTDLRVTESSPQAMTVEVAAGHVWLFNDQDTAAAEGGSYHVFNDAPISLVVPANSSGSSRTDTVWVRVRDSAYTTPPSGAAIVYLQGITTAPSDGSTYYKLATITVPNNAVSIAGLPASYGATDSQITDQRFAVGLCGTGGSLRDIVTFTSSGSFDKANFPWMKSARIRMVGGGAGGAACNNPSIGHGASGGAGGSGAYAESVLRVDQIPSGANTVTVGAGGASNTNGTQSSFGALVIAPGGTTGIVGTSKAVPSTGNSGGAGGVVGVGDITIPGSGGGVGVLQSATRVTVSVGGASMLSGSTTGIEISASTVGLSGLNYGGGGAGGASIASAASAAGGVGAGGIVIVELYG